jgi:hypothetical protein
LIMLHNVHEFSLSDEIINIKDFLFHYDL